MKDLFKKIDRLVFRAERVFVVAALVVMSVVVFLDVVHRTFASDEHKGVAAVVQLLGYLGQTIERGDATYSSLEGWLPYAIWAGFIALGVLGVRTAVGRERMPMPKALGLSMVGIVAVYGLIRVFVAMTPSGLGWSQRLALVLTLWVGFVAASMCTYENRHLKVEAAQRAIPEKYKPFVVFLSSMFSAAVCFALMWLSVRFLLQRYGTFVQSEGRGGIIEGLGLPLYQAVAVLPLSFSVMTTRFVARGLFALGGELPVAPSIEGLDQLEKYVDVEPAPSEVATQVASAVDDAPEPQRKVQTDPHSGPEGKENTAEEGDR